MWEKELQAAIEAAKRVIPVILEIYNSDMQVEIKSDNSPVTIADKTADKMIKEYLASIFPTHAFLTEESEDDLDRLNNDFVWIVDPIDGTKNFIAKDGEFTTSIALSYKHEIVVGVISAPALNEIYYASKGSGAYSLINNEVTKLHVNDKLTDLTCLVSVFHQKQEEVDLINKYKDRISKAIKVGSCLKACRIAQGKAELSYRLSDGTKEWDVAGISIIISESGGVFQEPDGTPIRFNRKDVYNRKGYIICNRKENILL